MSAATLTKTAPQATPEPAPAFVYQGLSQLADVRAELNRIRNARRARIELSERRRDAKDQFETLTTMHRFGGATDPSLASAKSELAALEAEWATADSDSRVTPAAVAYLDQREADLDRRERDENTARLRPLIMAAMAELDEAAEVMAEKQAAYDALLQSAGPLAVNYSNDWATDFRKSLQRNSKMMQWRFQNYKAGLLKPGRGWTIEHK